MKTTKKICFFILITICSLKLSAQDSIITLNLDTIHMNDFRFTIANFLDPEQIWSQDNITTDSILYTRKLGDNVNPIFLSVFMKRTNENVDISLLSKYNDFLDHNIFFTYNADSLRNWTYKTAPKDLFPRIDLKIPKSHKNETVDIELYLIPYKTNGKITHLNNNKLAQQFPLEISTTKYRKSKFNDHTEIYLSQYGNFTSIHVEEKGIFHKNKYIDIKEINQKNEYKIGDTVYLDNQPYEFKYVDSNLKTISLLKVSKGTSKVLHLDVLSELLPYFGENQFLLVDFWGTWCSPCIAELPNLLKLYGKVNKKCSLVSVCFDKTSNYEKAKEIFKDQNITWPQLFNDSENSFGTITNKLKISTFPSLLLIDKKGKILFDLRGRQDMGKITELILDNKSKE